MTEPASQNRQPNWAFALVHGIGTTQPMDMIQEVTDAMKKARPSLKLEPDAEVHEVREQGKVRHHVIRHGSIPGAKVRFGTAHWADITYYRQGFIALIGAFLMTAFGVRFFADVAARDARDAGFVERTLSFLLRHMLSLMAILLAVIVFPLTFVALVFSAAGLVAEIGLRNEIGLPGITIVDLQRWFIIIVGLAICCGYAAVGVFRVYPMRKERTLGLPIFVSIGLIALLIGLTMPLHSYRVDWPVLGAPAGHTCERVRDCLRELLMWATGTNFYLVQRINLVDGIGVYFALLHVAQLAAGIVLLLLTVGIVVVLAAYRLLTLITGRSAHTMVFAAVTTFSIWLILLIVLWPENLATYSAMLVYSRPAAEVPATISAIFLEWDKLPFRFFDEAIPVRGRTGLEGYYPIIWFEAFYFGFLCLALLLIVGILLSRNFWCWLRRKANLELFRIADGDVHPRKFNKPRLIVAHLYVWLVLALMTAASLVIVGHIFRFEPWLLQMLRIETPEPEMPQEVFFQGEWVRLLLIVSVCLFVMLSHTILDGMKLVLDVVNHFTQPAANYPVRRRIERRFDEIVDRLLARGDHPNLVIIAHSQGTVITLDALMRKGWVDKVLRRASTLTVITFGSPVTHVYQNYFPRLYPRLADTGLAELSKNPRVRWINAYRIDDYVGTYIENSIANFPVNVPLPVGGHTNYWTGDVMCRVMSEHVLHDFLLPALRQEPRHAFAIMEPDDLLTDYRR